MLDAQGTCRLARAVLSAWERAEPRRRTSDEVVLIDEPAAALLEGVWEWAGLPETACAPPQRTWWPWLRRFYPFVQQGGGAPEPGHRCPGEPGVVMMLEVLLPRLSRLEYDVPAQDDRTGLSRMPARPRSGMVLRPAV